MRGRRGRSSSLGKGARVQTRKAQKREIIDVVPSESEQMDQDTQEDKDAADGDKKDDLSMSLFSSSRDKRRRERENKPKPKEMTEDEMMDLALRLSEQEASVTALRRQQEEEAVLKAIQESMVDQTQPCPTSPSQSLLTDESFRLGFRRKLSYSTGKKATVDGQGVAEEGAGDENKMDVNQERRAGSPLLEMPDLSQTQKITSQTSPCSTDSLSAPVDSLNSDSTQIDDCQPPTSPVFPLSGCRVEVHVNRLSQNLLDTCSSSGFVLYSQDKWTETQKSEKSPPKSHVFLGQEDCVETQLSPVRVTSPVFGSSTQHEKSLSASKPLVSACSPTHKNSGFMFTSQESLTDSVSNTFAPTKSPVFPSIPTPSKNIPLLESPKSPDGEETEPSPSNSPVFGSTARQPVAHTDEELPSGAELQVPKGGRSPKQNTEASNKDGCHNFDSITLLSNTEELNESSKDRNSAEMEFSSNMTLVWSDGSDNDDDEVTPTGSPSPVFPEETPVQMASLNHVAAASSETSAPDCSLNPQWRAPSTLKDKQTSLGTSSPANSQQRAPTTEEEGQELHPVGSQGVVNRTLSPYEEPADRQTVHYYWGVPFCPRGLDPDKYTQVILAQMDVYEKSLKQAQRCLLRKAEWGEAILPQPEKSPSPESPAESPQFHAPRRRVLKRRGKTLSEAEESPSAEAGEEEEGGKKEEEEQREGEKKAEKTEEDDEPMDTDDCEVCPETQLSDDSTQILTMPPDAEAKVSQQPPPESPETPEVEMILQDDSPATVEPQVAVEEDELDVLMDEKMEGKNPVCSSSDAGGQTVRKEEVEVRKDPDVEEMTNRRLHRSMSPELEPAVVPHSPETSVDCPICQVSFPASRIEMHAAFCDGEVDDRKSEANCFQASLKPRRKRTRRAQATAEEANDHFDCERNQEKCFICQKGIPLQDYSRHTELCIQRQMSKTAAKGNLLSALEQTESRDSEAGPSGSKLQAGDVIDLLDDDEEEEDEEEQHISAVRVSNSPIRSFTPISEATDCLVDFKKQHRAKRLSQRRR